MTRRANDEIFTAFHCIHIHPCQNLFILVYAVCDRLACVLTTYVEMHHYILPEWQLREGTLIAIGVRACRESTESMGTKNDSSPEIPARSPMAVLVRPTTA